MMTAEHREAHVHLMVQLQCCHSVLNTTWPRPGVAAMRGAKMFIGTKLFIALETSVRDIAAAIQDFPDTEVKSALLPFWTPAEQLVRRLKQFGAERPDNDVDQAFNLLYLATGVAYHLVRSRIDQPPSQDDRYSSVEGLDRLLSLCAWSAVSSIANPEEQTQCIGRALTDCLQPSK